MSRWIFCDSCGVDFEGKKGNWSCPQCGFDMTPNREQGRRFHELKQQNAHATLTGGKKAKRLKDVDPKWRKEGGAS